MDEFSFRIMCIGARKELEPLAIRFVENICSYVKPYQTKMRKLKKKWGYPHNEMLAYRAYDFYKANPTKDKVNAKS